MEGSIFSCVQQGLYNCNSRTGGRNDRRINCKCGSSDDYRCARESEVRFSLSLHHEKQHKFAKEADFFLPYPAQWKGCRGKQARR